MVKTLQDCCLACIAKHFSSYQRLGNYLSSLHKEILLERMCHHGLLTKPNLPAISYALFSHTLQRVHFCFSSEVDDRCLELLGNSGCLPTSITIENCRNISDKGIASLARVVRKTEEFFLIKLRQLTGEGLKNLTSRALKHLSLHESNGITDPGLTAFIRNCPNIEKLCVAEVHKLSDATLICAAEVLGSKLLELDASDLNLVTSAGTTALATHCTNLETASFESDVKLDGSGLVQMAECCPISFLNISFCYKVPPQQVEVIVSSLRARGTLQTFEAMGISLSPIGLELLASTATLTKLSLCGVTQMNDEGVEMLTKSTGKVIESLDLSSCTLTDESCQSIARHCRCIEELGLRNLRDITGVPLNQLFLDKERAKNIRIVTLSGSRKIHSSVVETLVTNCSNLEIVTMAGLKGVTDTIALSIAHHCPAIRHISFRNCDISDVGVCEIAVYSSQLSMLAVAGVHCLTDKCILALAENCPYIEELYLSGCAKITKQAVTYLKDCAVNRVFINHNNPSAPIGLVMAKDIDTGEYTRVDDLKFDSLGCLSRARKSGGRLKRK